MATPKNLLVDVSQDPGLQYVTKRELRNASVAPREITGTSASQPIIINNITSDTRVYLKETVNVPGGTNNEVQINEGGQFVGDAGLRYNPNTDTLTTGTVVTNNLTILGAANFGSTLNNYATKTYVDDSISAIVGATTGNLRVDGYHLVNDTEDGTQYVGLNSNGGVIIQGKEGSQAQVRVNGSNGKVLLSAEPIQDLNLGYTNAVFNIPGHGLSVGDKVYITGITTTTELNGLSYYVSSSSTDVFELQYASNGAPVLSAGLASWDAGGGIVTAGNAGGDVYIIGGQVDDSSYGDMGNVNIGASTVYVETPGGSFVFGSDGNLLLPSGGTIKDSTGTTDLLEGIGSFSGTANSLSLTNNAILYPGPFADDPVIFTKTDYGDEVDVISESLSITRADNHGIYNPIEEVEWDDSFGYADGGRNSPKGTLWNVDGWDDLTNLSARTYATFYLVSGNQNLGNFVPYQEWIMKDTINDKYYKFEFVQNANGWGSNGRLSYTRTQLDGTTGDPIGDPVVFVRGAGQSGTVDEIDTGLTIKRDNNYPWYNSAQETGYSFNDNNGYDSPLGSEWNDDGWHDLHSVAERSYAKFYDLNDWQLGHQVLGKKFVMHDIGDNKYYTVKFTSWTQNNNGGGFSYVRQLIDTSQYFVHTAYGSEIDDIAENVGITRGENYQIYNPYTEDGVDEDVSPEGTLWNADGWDDLSDLTTRTYLPFFSATGGYGLRYKVPGKKYIMYVPSTDDYYAIEWIYWANGHDDPGGGFIYKRYSIDKTKINQGITFADGSVQTTAYQPDAYTGENTKVKSKAFGTWRILETSGASEIKLTAMVYSDSSMVTSASNRSDSLIVVAWDGDLFTAYIDESKDFQFSIDGGTTYFDVDRGGYSSGSYFNFYRADGTSMNTTEGQTLYYRTKSGGDPQRWFTSEADHFRGAIIDYQAYSYYSNAAIIGTIQIAAADGDFNITHMETSSGNNNTAYIDLWYRNTDVEYESETDIWLRRLDGVHDTIRIHWTAKIFTGIED